MNMLVLGCGMQGRAVLYDLARSDDVRAVTCADAAVGNARDYLDQLGSDKLRAVQLDASDDHALRDLIASGFDVIISMLPRELVAPVAEAAVDAGVHLVNTNYEFRLRHLADRAAKRGVALLPEMGFDPGIDLVLAAEAVRRFDRVTRLDSYGGGIPEPGADDNPLRYKISWSWPGVLDAYTRPGRLLRDGRTIDIPGDPIFNAEHVFTIDVEPVGRLEAYPNGDAVSYLEKLGIADTVRTTGRYGLRWPGHSQFWRVLAQFGFLDDTPNPSLANLSPRGFLREHLEPRLQYERGERDLCLLRVEAEGSGYRSPRLIFDMIDYRDLDSGLLAMNRTVGFPASIAARMIADGTITARGLLSPAVHVPFEPFINELRRRGIAIREIEV